MSMSLRDWVQYGWLTEHKSSREEIENLLGVVDRLPFHFLNPES